MRLVLALSLGCVTGCGVLAGSAGVKAQEAVNELNLNARFGRMELAGEFVAPKAKELFFERRKAWGGKVRVADYEVSGIKMTKNESDADLYVKVAWFRSDEGDLRTTTIKQKWHDFHGDWRLTDEARADGDVGLLGESIERSAQSNQIPRNAQFPTIRLGGVQD